MDDSTALLLLQTLQDIHTELNRIANAQEQTMKRQEEALAVPPDEAIQKGIEAMKKVHPVFAQAFEAMDKLMVNPAAIDRIAARAERTREEITSAAGSR